MTAESTQTEPRSRRALLAGALGGLGVWAASAIGRATPAEAAAGDPIRMGRVNLASSTATTLQTKTSRAAYLVNQLGVGAAVKGVATSGRAIIGEAGSNGTGVWGSSPNHNGVSGRTEIGTGVLGHATSGIAVWGVADSGIGVRAESQGFNPGLVAANAFGGLSAIFDGPLQIDAGYQDISEIATPAVPLANTARMFVRDNGTGKTQLCVRFATGAVQVIATEP